MIINLTRLLLTISLTLKHFADSSTIVVKPTIGAATLIPGQSLHFECAQVGKDDPQFIW